MDRGDRLFLPRKALKSEKKNGFQSYFPLYMEKRMRYYEVAFRYDCLCAIIFY